MMKLRSIAGALSFLTLTIPLCLILNAGPALAAGSFRMTMNDGTMVEVPYYWEEGGEYKFEVPGGAAGIPIDQVKSILEIVESREFTPETVSEAPDTTPANAEQKKMLREIVESKVPLKASSQAITPDEGLRMLATGSASVKGSGKTKDRTYAPDFKVEGDFSQFARVEGNDLMVIMRSVLSSRKDLKKKSFVLTLFDSEGNVLGQKPCELQQIDIDKKTMKKLGLKGGRLYTLIASIKPDTKIRRYEIAALEH